MNEKYFKRKIILIPSGGTTIKQFFDNIIVAEVCFDQFSIRNVCFWQISFIQLLYILSEFELARNTIHLRKFNIKNGQK